MFDDGGPQYETAKMGKPKSIMFPSCVCDVR